MSASGSSRALSPERAGAEGGAVSGSGHVVLVVDDAPRSLGSLCIELENEGYTVLVAASGEAALERLDLVTPDAILLDAMMPGLDGFATCARIKRHAAWAHIPVIFMTGLSDTDDVLRGFAAGGVDYVVKPVRAPEVVARLATHVRNARTARMAREAIEVGGHGVVMVDGQRRVAWHSPQAQRWLVEFFEDEPDGAGVEWLYSSGAAPPGRTRGARTLVARRLGSVGLGEDMWLLGVQRADVQLSSRVLEASLTPRETEVLSWIAKGKTNRDVAEILGMSPRTVNKHLERVFEKLGVETRAAAAALASREG
ncbi:response regulator transcription factor [Piscinibacter koreensis]|uniref:Response regulator transcription factor n=1 Tax=Piscinibacter koreensis TaxID=2742824 RepID=A0A7Y6NNF6_9BURK|nr:response regulator transcription factor [Schlegelella koreensis]NUZ06284.1 response regulator transcription factor [Schlegelella koreensis]